MPVKLEPYKRNNGNRIFADTMEEKWSKKAFFSMFVISMEIVIHHLFLLRAAYDGYLLTHTTHTDKCCTYWVKKDDLTKEYAFNLYLSILLI